MTTPQLPSPCEALAIADSLLRSRYAGAAFAFVAGSIIRGHRHRHPPGRSPA
ncbi:hypothetical protein [Pseudomonas sp. ABC1]|uniref:hypothetical protein n=1 Tax=Pseudomonas sp. ABC1 TaxID=2748080 RepID=UPI001C4DF4B9|nr:hypothetical protein [Pseudomonas sp. ABC1]